MKVAEDVSYGKMHFESVKLFANNFVLFLAKKQKTSKFAHFQLFSHSL